MKKKNILVLLIMFILILCGCENKEDIEMPKENPIVTMNIKDFGTIKIELYPKIAFNTVANFVSLTQNGFYDNNTIHRVQKGFVIQGGDPTGTGTGGPDYTIKGEFNQNGFKNDLSHTKGIISMARTSDPDSAGSQFFIVLSDDAASSLDGMYAAFGEIIEGMDIIEKIENTDFEIENELYGTLKKPITIESTTVDTKGYEYKVVKN
ncbi:MAG: peptidylprolyl isomerase [Bacilli bacterium]